MEKRCGAIIQLTGYEKGIPRVHLERDLYVSFSRVKLIGKAKLSWAQCHENSEARVLTFRLPVFVAAARLAALITLHRSQINRILNIRKNKRRLR